MTHLVPESWRHAAGRLRDDIHDALDRWLHRPKAKEEEPRELALEPSWPPVPRVAGGLTLDVEETDDDVIVTADLPGLDRDDFTVELSGERLVIRGEKKRESEKRGRGYYYAERSYGAFARSVMLPCEVDPNKAKAKHKGGVLRITLPKTARAKSRRVQVRVQD